MPKRALKPIPRRIKSRHNFGNWPKCATIVVRDNAVCDGGEVDWDTDSKGKGKDGERQRVQRVHD